MTKKPQSRRSSLKAIGLAAMLTAATIGSAGANPASPEDAVRGFYQSLLTTMQQGSALGAQGRYQKLAPAVEQAFDIARMTALSVGPGWSALPQSQKSALEDAFRRYVTATWADRFASYSGEQLEVTGDRPYQAEYLVETKIVPQSGDPTEIDYLMQQSGGAWQIVDVYLGGTVSQLAVERSAFASVLGDTGPDGLVRTLNHKAMVLADNTQH